MVQPLLQDATLATLDLEGVLEPPADDSAVSTPETAFGVDLIQVYLPKCDIVLLIHAPSIGADTIRASLGPWLESREHVKVLCDLRADSEALSVAYGVRLQGVLDVQVAHAALRGEFKPLLDASGGLKGPAVSPLPFFFPAGLARLVSSLVGVDEAPAQASPQGEPSLSLKARFGERFNAGERPFRVLPLSEDAATYAAGDVWHIWAVHGELWARVEQRDGALRETVRVLSEVRAAEFRDAPGGNGRAVWMQRLEQARAAMNERPTKRSLRSQPAPRPQEVSGPMCPSCGVRFSGEKQLAEHQRGRRHAVAAALSSCADPPPPLLVECRRAPMDRNALREEFGRFGRLRRVALRHGSNSKGPWRATVVYARGRDAARAMGQRVLVLNDVRVTAKPLSASRAERYHKKRAERRSQKKSGSD